MVKLQPSKLAMRVRFPLPALTPRRGGRRAVAAGIVLRGERRESAAPALTPCRFRSANRTVAPALPTDDPGGDGAPPSRFLSSSANQLDSPLRGADEAAYSVHARDRSARGRNSAMREPRGDIRFHATTGSRPPFAIGQFLF